jgi:magnesium-transporting ATPase (P-type)
VGFGDRHTMIFSGTAATYGRGKAVVTATGMQTQMDLIAGMLKEAPRRPPRYKRNSPVRVNFSASSSW